MSRWLCQLSYGPEQETQKLNSFFLFVKEKVDKLTLDFPRYHKVC